jgi:tetratricopeptide (TPR) repeat protein
MRVSRTLGGRVLLAAVASVPTLASADPVPRSEPISAQVVSVRQGEDIVFAGTQDAVDVVVRQDLKAGDVIKTHADGAVAIVFADQMQIRLARNTTLLVKQVSNGVPSEIELTQGSLWARAPRGQSQLTLRTPSATAAIRGTEWGLRVEGGETRLDVASGSVEFFNDQGRLFVDGGQAASAVTGQTPVRLVVVNRGTREQMLYYLSRDFIPDPLSANDPFFSAFEAATRGEFDAALTRLNAQDFSTNPLAYVLAVKIGFLTGSENQIADSLTSGLQAFPNHPDLVTLNAEYLAAYKGRPDLALTDARRAVEIAPDNVQSLRVLSQIYLERRMTLAAQEAIDRAITLSPQSPELYLQQADVYLRQNKPGAAKAALSQAFSLTPEFSVSDLGTAHILALFGDNEEALAQALAASANNPGYAPSLLRLAEIYGRLNELVLAEQQLDAADRIDPNSPLTPLYRTALALHQYEGSDGIHGSQEALGRFQARGGLYENLSENRESGSNISRAFRFMEMEAWGRYYGDRVFDRFAATSYFDQTLNETPGPFFIRGEDTQFNPQNGDDLDQISSYLQGVVLDPLSVAQSGRRLQIDKDEFLEATLGGTAIIAETSDLIRASASVQGRYYMGQNGRGIPVAFSLRGQTARAEQNTLDLSGGARPDLIDETLKNGFIETYAGAELSPRDHIVAFAKTR